jgi:uncharacterized protein (TIGR03118 family)
MSPAALTTPTPTGTGFVITPYASDQAGTPHVDPKLVNGWGISSGPATGFWIANQGSGTSTVYDGLGASPVPDMTVTVPAAPGIPAAGPTGVAYNATTDFAGDTFIFVSLDGTVSGWSAGAAATLRKDNSGAGALYTGVAIAASGTVNRLYAANFGKGTIDVLDSAYQTSDLGASAFQDATLPTGYLPFNIQAFAGKLYVAYAQKDATGRSLAGAGLGIVNVFNPDGSFSARFASQGTLDAPWGMAMAPAGFGNFGGALLVGNFGDGRITAFDASTGAPLGQLSDALGTPVSVPGLWGLRPGNGAGAGVATQIYYAAGPSAETHGAFGTISFGAPASAPGGGGYYGGGTGY